MADRSGSIMTNALRPLLLAALLLVPLFASGPVCATYLSVEDEDSGLDIRVWANDGGEKIPREQIRAFAASADPGTVNSVWDGTGVSIFGARNEVVSFALVVDNGGVAVSDVSANFSALATADDSYQLETTETAVASLFDWRNRPIEVFVVEYLKVHGLSFISYATYDETHIPFHLQRPVPVDLHPVGGPNVGEGVWADRPYHDLSYPDIAIPQELQAVNGGVSIDSQASQIFWVDVYIPKDAPAGVLAGEVTLDLGASASIAVPVSLEVYDFALPDERVAKSMVYIEALDLKKRYFTGANTGLPREQEQAFRDVMNHHYRLAWRHGISLFDQNELLPDTLPPIDKPNIDWEQRLTASFYSAENGYAGPGADEPHDLFVIGSYGAWAYWWDLRQFNPISSTYDPDADESLLQSVLEDKTTLWENWFVSNAPETERFLYVDDEPTVTLDYAERVAGYVENSSSLGSEIGTFITASPLDHSDDLPSPSIFASLIAVAPTEEWEAAQAARPDRTYYMYNGRRPASGSFATDDDGVALRSLVWGQYKKNVQRWFYWHSTYYNNTQGGPATRVLSEVAGGDGESYRSGSETNVFKSAHTFGGHDRFEEPFGERGFNYGNGDGLLFYPGTDLVFPEENLGLAGPIASLRLKHWRRGIQDAQYLSMASEYAPIEVEALVQEMIPEALWEIGVQLVSEPSYVHKAPSWSIDPDDWEAARRQLAELIRVGMIPVGPAISTQPQNISVTEGEVLQLTVVASGNPAPEYQWMKADELIPGAVFASYTVQEAMLADAGEYSVVVSNAEGSLTSDTVTVAVEAGLAAPLIESQPGALTVAEGESAVFVVGASGNPVPDYQWFKDGEALPGATTNEFSIAAASLADAGVYSVEVSNSEGSVLSSDASLVVQPLATVPMVVVPPTDVYSLAGQPVTLSVTVSGTPAPTLQWYRDGVALLGATDPVLSLVANRSDMGRYSVIASNSAGSVESASAELVVGLLEADVAFIVRNAASLNTNERRIRDVLLGLGHNLSIVSDNADLLAATASSELIVISGIARAAAIEGLFAQDTRPVWVSQSLVYDEMGLVAAPSDVVRYGDLQSLSLTSSANPIGATLAAGSVQVVDRNKQFVGSRPVAGAKIYATIEEDPTRAAIFSLTRGDTLADGSTVPGKRLGWFSTGYAARRWTDSGQLLFEQSIAWLLDAIEEQSIAPSILEQPNSATASDGETVTFSVTASGVPEPAVQWFFNGAPIISGTGMTLSVVASEASAGEYSVTLSNDSGSVTSEVVTLTLEQDTTPPALVSITPLDAQSLRVEFSEAVSLSSAELASNFVLDQAGMVLLAERVAPAVVVLQTSSLSADTAYVLTVNNVSDEFGNEIAQDSQIGFTTPSDSRSVALVVGSLTLSRPDETWRDALIQLGYDVELFLDRRATSSSTAAHSLVVISGTSRATRIDDAFLADSRPVLISELLLFDDMQVTGGVDGVDFGLQSRQMDLNLADNGSQIGAGLPLGLVRVTDRNRTINWGLAGTGAQVFATVDGDSTRATVFGYRSGDVLADGSLAAGHRLVWHDYGVSANRWTTDGELLFAQALQWLLAAQ